MDIKGFCFSKTNVFLVITFGVGVLLVRRQLRFKSRRNQLEKLIRRKNIERKYQVKDLNTRLQCSNEISKRRAQIVNLNFNDLKHSLQTDVYTPMEVLEAFQESALKATKLTNCVCEFLPEATEWATDLQDKYYKSSNKPPLYGIPISVKECYKVEGHTYTAGFAQFLAQYANENSPLIDILKSSGAVPFVLTNLPQSMKSLGCSNPIFGLTTNPHDPSRSCGGSSGGEAALIARRGSPLGLGSDIGGSVRVPAHFCGICSLKPTAKRLDQTGRRSAVPGVTAVYGTAGPMGPDVDSLIWFCRTLWIDHHMMHLINPYVAPLPFDENLFSKNSKLTIGFYDFDGHLEATPSCRRAVAVATDALKKLGHTVVPFSPPHVSELVKLYLAAVVPDGGVYLSKLFTTDIIDSKQNELAKFLSVPVKLRRLMGRAISVVKSRRTVLPYTAYTGDTFELSQIYQRLNEYKEKFVNLWLSAKLDCVVCPVLPCPALPLDLPSKLFKGGASYSVLYNALDFPSGVIPVTNVTPTDDDQLEQYSDSDSLSRIMKIGSKNAVGMPVGVQIVCLPYKDELCLRIMKELESFLSNQKD